MRRTGLLRQGLNPLSTGKDATPKALHRYKRKPWRNFDPVVLIQARVVLTFRLLI
jgi:hypothetical protein